MPSRQVANESISCPIPSSNRWRHGEHELRVRNHDASSTNCLQLILLLIPAWPGSEGDRRTRTYHLEGKTGRYRWVAETNIEGNGPSSPGLMSSCFVLRALLVLHIFPEA